jgi:hypothetical protein
MPTAATALREAPIVEVLRPEGQATLGLVLARQGYFVARDGQSHGITRKLTRDNYKCKAFFGKLAHMSRCYWRLVQRNARYQRSDLLEGKEGSC